MSAELTSSGPLRLMTVHAHPDDESSKGAATTARYVSEGHEVMVVTCTGGEAGSILNPAMDRPEVLENLPAIRRAEIGGWETGVSGRSIARPSSSRTGPSADRHELDGAGNKNQDRSIQPSAIVGELPPFALAPPTPPPPRSGCRRPRRSCP